MIPKQLKIVSKVDPAWSVMVWPGPSRWPHYSSGYWFEREGKHYAARDVPLAVVDELRPQSRELI